MGKPQKSLEKHWLHSIPKTPSRGVEGLSLRGGGIGKMDPLRVLPRTNGYFWRAGWLLGGSGCNRFPAGSMITGVTRANRHFFLESGVEREDAGSSSISASRTKVSPSAMTRLEAAFAIRECRE